MPGPVIGLRAPRRIFDRCHPSEHSLKRRAARGPSPPVPTTAPTAAQRLGKDAEDAACAYLCSRGLRIEARNVRYRAGEIDAVARDGPCWVFVEVRCRGRAGDAAVSIDARKRGKIRRATQLYLLERFGNTWPQCRFDVVIVEGSRIQWLQAAFFGEEE
jgi:putative endonuclease